MDILLASSVPLGAGLSSSAAVEIATASLCNQAFGLDLSPQELAAIGRRAEHEFAGVPCGIMDQLISASATAGAATLIDCRSMACRPVRLPTDAAFVLADSGVRRALASGEYAARRESCRRAAAALGLGSLRDATSDLLTTSASSMSECDLACAKHVVSENTRVIEFVEAMLAEDLAAAGTLMNASHASLRDGYLVSCNELDMLVAAATAIPGVFGSRMTGGGFGGCTVTLCRKAAVGALCDALGRGVSGAGTPAMRPYVASPVGGASAWIVS